ncbi:MULTISPECIES: hypothetical protein [unclassified Bradyrhizobium]|uniref:hypothetical protein n=1 Tax=unclassified Bradyrhizobium TaxID=2631580 RepID=UPI0028EE4E70|nr:MULTISPECIES: hypothetical protein [unclassified Bradyrhizobium]
MSDTITIAGRDTKTGRFLPGNSGNGGRKPGSRNRLGELFMEDLRQCWQERGAEALRRCAEDEPAQFVRVVASLLPKDININGSIGVSAQSVLENFRMAVAALGNKPPERLPMVRMIGAERS